MEQQQSWKGQSAVEKAAGIDMIWYDICYYNILYDNIKRKA